MSEHPMIGGCINKIYPKEGGSPRSRWRILMVLLHQRRSNFWNFGSKEKGTGMVWGGIK